MSSLQSITLNLSGVQFSDLFFNYDHPNRDKLYEGRKPDRNGTWPLVPEDEERAAIRQDAIDFLIVVGLSDFIEGTEDIADALADDFMRRR